MSMWEFTDEDVKQGMLVDPDWYKLNITAHDPKEAANGESINNIFTGVIVCRAKDGDEEFAGVPVRWNLNTKMKTAGINFIVAVTGEPIQTGRRYNPADAVGGTIEAMVERDEYNGVERNTINHKYRSAK
jgi:hypothetical protein